MSDWIPVPEPVVWTLPAPVTFNGVSYATITLRAPSVADTLKATAVSGISGIEVVLQLIETVSAERVPQDVLKQLPEWLLGQMSGYFELFAGAPGPDPLEQWRQARRASLEAGTGGA